ncbi:tricarballylate utilization 4Fe-4S protein TcuB [Pseudosulfitobacter pseudonitzschiae]|uniref:tricarballylate utilization 4Fe-4S protein TcuB n=1 Tax=Pseudosulfitobacter pseudonitzschiae TaxID=1402135 RepID=UPI001AF9ECCE|nr:tricarballylate utilization 4Fe-4S protein TcuB [Pseudosulfitobacter pseudonitzschiae]MBM1817392.1 tricarballylate utilization 4Fe-4S protein TcuB [Pseudosulfitobacter pseudonitzschiae]MBM1834590.1 tricarballylate utilization 4Fe-4S protein TcuB [Pseudosulfitobacter pseudonitzschiae]MBM1839455.1 tricarballylate utilization 4Fe-4S protein TcuB [Pseudosulfitobacter pseudonitzschiae]MBM1844305.1 tricarballylate utilization 4Fe-4S protein TcuB [Pseudosulfitobacter pseudonitzschiae]MBM1849140.1 
MQTDLLHEARRQAEICNACRYCEGYCSVFPALHSERAFSDGDLTQLANLCHNCRGCYYACQYTAPHEFDLNLPQALANVRQDSWEDLASPRAAGKAFQKSGVMIALVAVIGFALLFWAARALATQGGEGFYAVLSHNAMVAIFLPAFLFPLFSIAISLRRYWRQVGAQRLKAVHLVRAFGQAANMRNLKGGHGDGCNFEDEDRFSQGRRMAHQAVMYGFLLCFASTSVATVMHYGLNMPAPYPLWSLPKLLGVSGGLLLVLGCVEMVRLKLRADTSLGAQGAFGGEIAFVGLLGFVGLSGLVLYGLGQTAAMPVLLALHLGSVLALFLLTPFTKMAHGFYRLAALAADAQRQ